MTDRSSAANYVKIILALIGVLGTGYGSGLVAVGDRDRATHVRIDGVEQVRENQYKALLARLDEIKAQQERDRKESREDLNQVRAEILRLFDRTRPQ